MRLVRSAMVSAILCDWLVRVERADDVDAVTVGVLEEEGVEGLLLRSNLTRLLTGVEVGAEGAAAALVEAPSVSLSVEYSESLPSSGSESALPE